MDNMAAFSSGWWATISTSYLSSKATSVSPTALVCGFMAWRFCVFTERHVSLLRTSCRDEEARETETRKNHQLQANKSENRY